MNISILIANFANFLATKMCPVIHTHTCTRYTKRIYQCPSSNNWLKKKNMEKKKEEVEAEEEKCKGSIFFFDNAY